MSAMQRSRDLHTTLTMLLSVIMVGLGVAMVVIALAGGGGPLAKGVILGVLFVAVGAGRLWVARR
jgi:multisubunit Na+/H+ antiporter MnhB subunit